MTQLETELIAALQRLSAISAALVCNPAASQAERAYLADEHSRAQAQARALLHPADWQSEARAKAAKMEAQAYLKHMEGIAGSFPGMDEIVAEARAKAARIETMQKIRAVAQAAEMVPFDASHQAYMPAQMARKAGAK